MNNSCTGCAAATGNKYYVDPMNGDDATATGSGIVGGVANPSCSFQTVTRALQVVGSFAGAPARRSSSSGRAGQTVPLDATETLPIIVPANVTIATQAGPIRVNLPASSDPNLGNVAGFQLGGDLAALAPDPAAPHHHRRRRRTRSGIGIGVSPGAGKSAALSYVTVQNTRRPRHRGVERHADDRAGRDRHRAPGTALKRRDGLNVAGGLVNITVAARPGADHVQQQHPARHLRDRARASSTSPASRSPCPRPTGRGPSSRAATPSRACASSRRRARPRMSTINGLVAWQNTQNGLRLYGGDKVKVRNSVFLTTCSTAST